MGRIASQITSLTIAYSTVYSGADQRKHQSSAWLAFVWETHRWPVNSPHKGPVARKMFPFDNVIMFVGDCDWQPSWTRGGELIIDTPPTVLSTFQLLQHQEHIRLIGEIK